MRAKKVWVVRIAQVAVAIVLVSVLGMLLVVRSQGFRNYLRDRLIQETQASVGARLELQRLELSFFPVRIALYDVTLHGSEETSAAPLLRADRLEVGLGVRALLRHEVDLRSVELSRPVVHIYVDAKGNSNLPAGISAQTSGSQWSAVIHHLVVQAGMLDYNDRRVPLDADLNNLRAELNRVGGAYEVAVDYDRGTVVAQKLNPVEHEMHARFSIQNDEMRFQSMEIANAGSRIRLTGDVKNLSSPQVQAEYHGALATDDLSRITKSSVRASGTIEINGTLRYTSSLSSSALNSLVAEGDARSKELSLREQKIAGTLRAVRGEYQLSKGILSVTNFTSETLGGRIKAKGKFALGAGNGASEVDAVLQGVSLEQLARLANSQTQKDIRLAGKMNAETHAQWADSVSTLTAHSRAVITAPTVAGKSSDGIPVNGILDFTYDGGTDTAVFAPSHLQTGGTEIQLSGSLGHDAKLAVQVSASDLHETAQLVNALSGSNVRVSDAAGAAKFTGNISGAVKNPRIQGRLVANGATYQQVRVRSLQTDLDLSNSQLILRNGTIVLGEHGRASLDGHVQLHDWSYSPEREFVAESQLSNVAIDDVMKLANIAYPVSGEVAGRVSLHGTPLHPQGNAAIKVVNATAYGEPITQANLQLRGDATSLQINGDANLPAGAVAVNATYTPSTGRYAGSLRTTSLDLARIDSIRQKAASPSGKLTANLSGSGTLSDPGLSGTLEIVDLNVNREAFTGTQARVEIANHSLHFDLNSTMSKGTLQSSGTVQLRGDYQAQAEMDIRALPLGPLLASYGASAAKSLQGETEIHAKLSGPLKHPEKIEAQLQIPELKFKYETVELANTKPINLEYRDGVLTIVDAEMKGTGTDVTLRGRIPIKNSDGFAASIKGSVDLAILRAYSADVQSSGRLDLDVTASGALKEPKLRGQLSLSNAAYSSDALPVGFSAVNGKIAVDEERLQIEELSGTAGGGHVVAHGSLNYNSGENFNLDLQATQVRIHQAGVRAVLDASLQLGGSRQRSTLNGRVDVDRLSFEEGFDISQLGNQGGGVSVDASDTLLGSMRVNVLVQTKQNLSLSSSQVSMAGSANLNVVGSAANPVVLGRISLTGGEVFFLSKRFEVQNGTIGFANTARTEPVVNLNVTTTVEQYNISLHFQGPLDRLQTNYSSDPVLPPADIINLLAFGQTTAESSSKPASSASLGAESVLAQGAAGQISGNVQRLTGISQLTIDPLAGNSQNPGSQVAIQQRVSGSLLLTFSTDVTSTQSQTVRLEYQPKKRVSISVLRDQNGGYGVDVRYHKVF